MVQVKRRISAAAVPTLLELWLKDDSLPYDITVCAGRRHQGERQLVFTIMGTTQEDITAKWEALERTIESLNNKHYAQGDK